MSSWSIRGIGLFLLMSTFIAFQVDNTKVLLYGDKDSLADNGLLGVLIHSLKNMEDLVLLEEFIDEGDIVDVVCSSQSLHVPQNADIDCV